jgi:hypothetical protein
MPEGSQGPLPERADVAVSGAGFTGLSAVRSLASSARLIVLDDLSKMSRPISYNRGLVINLYREQRRQRWLRT